ncbi:hypothetical protein ACJIZ3_002482 [Penstemon smallii]|uniref:Ubiquitin-like domain-containing protein n=1 Tax=Penstemon smallii TaxID=265156 RepID=A0ABD3U6I5_9LAMI
MELIFQPSRGDSFRIEIGHFDTILEIKEKIQQHQGIPIRDQTLHFNGEILPDELKVHDSDILDQSCIFLLVSPDGKMEYSFSSPSSMSKIMVAVKLDGSKLGIMLEIDANESIRSLKERICASEGVPIEKLIVRGNGIELTDDDKSLKEYEISDDSEIEVDVNQISVQSVNPPKQRRIVVVSQCGRKRIRLEVFLWNNVGVLRKKLEKVKEEFELDLRAYFFIFKQNLMDEDRSFRSHEVGEDDVIEMFNGTLVVAAGRDSRKDW